ncbi:MAG: botulinum neurotoxin N-terminal receptor binding domain-containing protein, partial [Anaerolineales bacterium]|nr:botulinum neurotoxin N-terminal receptor binding domain-containing protein [Anaerolineales bacterium]
DSNGNNGWTSAGKRGKSLIFDGSSDYVEVPDSDNWYFADEDFTVNFWVKFNNNTAQSHPFFSQGLGTNDESSFLLLSDGTFRVWSYPSMNLAFSNVWGYNPDDWHHITLRRNGNTFGIFIDGEFWESKTSSQEWRDEAAPLTIGAGGNSWGDQRFKINGSLDEFAIWKRALSETEINASFNAGMYRLERNFTGLSEGNYTYKAYVVDAAGNMNGTGTRSFFVDSTTPSLSIVPYTLANGSFQNVTFAYVNVTTSDSGTLNNELSAFIDFNNSLVGYWRFEDDGSTTEDFTSNNLDATLTNFGCTVPDCNLTGGPNGEPAGYVSSGRRGHSIEFDGVDDYLQIAQTDTLDIMLDNFSVMFWYKSRKPNERQVLVMKGGNNNADEGWQIWVNNNDIFVKITNGSATHAQSKANNVVGTVNRWFHVAVIMDTSGNLSQYVNGLLHDTDVLSDIVIDSDGINSNDVLRMGASTSSGSFLNGTLDEVQIFRRLLSEEEINASFSAGMYRLERNFTGLIDDNYTWSAYVVDAAGNIQNTTPQEFVVDTVAPAIEFVAHTPANNSFINDYIFINTTESDGSEHDDYSAFIDFN